MNMHIAYHSDNKSPPLEGADLGKGFVGYSRGPNSNSHIVTQNLKILKTVDPLKASHGAEKTLENANTRQFCV